VLWRKWSLACDHVSLNGLEEHRTADTQVWGFPDSTVEDHKEKRGQNGSEYEFAVAAITKLSQTI
jgi:hypothetical protein